MSNSASIAGGSVNPNIFDVGSLTTLKRQVKSNDPAALKQAAQQFEALFLQMVLKSMRDAVPREGLFDNEQSRMYESLLDQQLSQVLGKKSGGTGLAALIEKQLLRQSVEPQALDHPLPLQPAIPSIPFHNGGALPLRNGEAPAAFPLPAAPAPSAPNIVEGAIPSGAKDFVSRIWPAAVEASRQTGIPAHFMVGHAALETGWGKSEPRRADGSPSHNIFGIKAGRNWSGAVAEATTTEYVDGVPQKQVERFRAYSSYNEAFRDYANLLASNPRYGNVLGVQDASSFARGLQKSGYATDPQYGEKLERIIGGNTLRQAFIG